MKINPYVYGGLVILVFLGIIFGFQLAGFWSTSGKVDSSGKAIQPIASDPSSIKGWMTLEQVVTVYDVTQEEIVTEFSLPEGTLATTALKDLESDTFDTSSLVDWLLVKKDQIQSNEIATQNTASPVQSEDSEDKKITGNTTFQDLIDWGISEDKINALLNDKLPVTSMKVKDYATQKGLEFSEIKTLLQLELDKNK